MPRKQIVIGASALDAQMTNSSGTNLDMRSMPERLSPRMGLVNGSEAWMPNRRIPVITNC